jgi:DUF2975 family protein
MNPAMENRLLKVRKLSRFGNAACIALMIATCLVAGVLVPVGLAFPEHTTCDFGAGSQPCGDWSAGERGVAFGLLTIGAALFFTGLYYLSRLFRNYARGEIFTRDSVWQIRRIGWTVFVFGALQVVLLVASLVLIGTDQIARPEHRPISLPFAAFISGGLIILVSWVMELGTELREEHELTV